MSTYTPVESSYEVLLGRDGLELHGIPFIFCLQQLDARSFCLSIRLITEIRGVCVCVYQNKDICCRRTLRERSFNISHTAGFNIAPRTYIIIYSNTVHYYYFLYHFVLFFLG